MSGGWSRDLIVFAARFPCPPFGFEEFGRDIARIRMFAPNAVSLEVYEYDGEDDNCTDTKALNERLAEWRGRRKLTHQPGHARVVGLWWLSLCRNISKDERARVHR